MSEPFDLPVEVGVLKARVDGIEARMAVLGGEHREIFTEIRHIQDSLRADMAALAVRLSDYAINSEKARSATLVAALLAAGGGIVSLAVTVLNHVL